MRGGSQSSLVGASNGKFYIVKFANSPQGPNLPFNEALGTILAQYLGLPTPDWRPLRITPRFIKANPDVCFVLEGGVTCQPAPGLHFGSEFVMGSDEKEVYEIVPEKWMHHLEEPELFAGMLLLDIWTENVDRRQAIFIDGAAEGRGLKAVFFDHGHMFQGSHGNKPLTNPLSCIYYHDRVYKGALQSPKVDSWLSQIDRLSEEMLRAMMERIPREWRYGTLEDNAIALLTRNRRFLRWKIKEVAEGLTSIEKKRNERAAYM